MRTVVAIIVTATALAVGCFLLGYAYCEWIENKPNMVIDRWMLSREYIHPDTDVVLGFADEYDPAELDEYPAYDEPLADFAGSDGGLPDSEKWSWACQLKLWHVVKTLPARSRDIPASRFIETMGSRIRVAGRAQEDVNQAYRAVLKLVPGGGGTLGGRYVVEIDDGARIHYLRAHNNDLAADAAIGLLWRYANPPSKRQ